jgi:guanine deaminase
MMLNPFMQRAIALSIDNIRTGRGGPFACVVARDGQIVAEGTNLVTSTNDPTAHAEVVAIRKACETLQTWQLTDCEIYASCEPCPMCLGAIYWARPAKLFFANTAHDAAAIGFDDHFIYEQLVLQHQERSIPTNQLMRDEAMEAFRLWKKIADKIEY